MGVAHPAYDVRCHYSGLLMGHCPEEPGIVVLARDHEELATLMEQALDEASAVLANGDPQA